MFSPKHPFPAKELKKQRAPDGARRVGKRDNFLRRHYPHQVKGSKRTLPLSRPAPLFFKGIMTFDKKLVKRLANNKKSAYDEGN